jgi:hypothetical protein
MIYSGLKNPTWTIKDYKGSKLIKLSKRSPEYIGGIPALVTKGYKGCILSDSKGVRISCSNGFLIIYDKSVIEFREDVNCTIENEILRSAPGEVYKQIYHFI